jgi:hypothetical protein
MGKKGGSSQPHITVPSGVSSNSFQDQTLGAYASSLLTPTLSLANWASSIATGGFGGQADYQNSKLLGSSGLANLQNQNTYANPFGLGGSGGTGAVGGGSAAATPGTPGTAANAGTGTFGGYYASQNFGVGGNDPAKAPPGVYYANSEGNRVNAYGVPIDLNGNPVDMAHEVPIAGTAGTAATPGTPASTAGSGGGAAGSQLGPFLQAAWNAIQAEGAPAAQLGNEGTNIYNEGQGLLTASQNMMNQGQSILGQGQGMVNTATTGTGLYASQQAMVDQATKSQQAAIQQQMASEGLTSSTQNAQLKGQAAQQGAATAGQLIQQNIAAGQAQMGIGQNQIQLGEGLGQLAQGFTQLGVASQQAAISVLGQIASQSAQLQTNMWTEAMQGYGLVGQFLNSSLSAFGESTAALGQYTHASEVQQQLQFQAQASQASASSSGMSSMLGGLGQLLGGGQGGGGLGGLIGGLGGAAGGIAAGGAATAAGASAIGAIGGAAGAAGGAGAAVSAAATAAGAAFCAGEEPCLPNGRTAQWKRGKLYGRELPIG